MKEKKKKEEKKKDSQEKNYTAQNKVEILDIGIDPVTYEEALDKISDWLDKSKRAQIATVNPEFILESLKNKKFKQTLNEAQLAVADGIGIRAAAKLADLPKVDSKIIKSIQVFLQGLFLIGPSVLFNKSYLDTIPETVTGADLSKSIAELCAKKDKSIFLLGAAPGVAKEAASKLQAEYEGLTVSGYYSGSPKKQEEKKIIKKINKAQPDVLLVAYSFPEQDNWINRNLDKFNKPLVAMGVGGTLDFIAGRVKRAPKSWRKLGLEWLYRLLQEPAKRGKRIWRAAFVFPVKVAIEEIRNNN